MTASSDYYDDDDVLSRSPGLQPIHVKAKPSPSPPPFIPQIRAPASSEDVSTSSSKRRKRANRPKARASQGDAVLINFLGSSNHPDIARTAGERPLNSASQSEASGSEEEMEGDVHGPVVKSELGAGSDPLAQNTSANDSLVNLAKAALPQTMQLGIPTNNAPESRKDSAISTSPDDDRRASVEGSRNKLSALSMTTPPREYEAPRSRFSSLDESLRLGNERMGGLTSGSRRPSRLEQPEGLPPGDSINDSPRLRKHAISPSEISPRQTLPAMHDPNSPSNPLGSPNTERKLPSFQTLSEIAGSASQEQHEARSNSISHQHRPSTSLSSASTQSAIAHSPSQISRSFTIGPPLSSHTSPPVSAHSLSDPSPAESFFRYPRELTSLSPPSASSIATGSSPYFLSRQQSQAREIGSGSYPSSVPSTSTSESHPNTGDHNSAGHTSAEHRMSLDATARPNLTLPPPVPTQGPREGPPPVGGYRCEDPGCTAPPFQTQYLLKYVYQLLFPRKGVS